MASCPRCQFANPDRARACDRCGLPLIEPDLAGPLAERVQPPASVSDSQPLPPKSDLAAPFAGSAIVVTVSDRVEDAAQRPPNTPADETVCDRIAPGKSLSGVVGETPAPTPSGPSDPVMNEAEHPSSSPATIPATDRADEPPAPAPPPPLRAKLVVLRGVKISVEYPIYEGRNTVGRFADKPVDIDLYSQETPEQIWCSRQHATLTFDRGNVVIEDLNSLNGTWVNGVRIHAGQPRQLRPGDVVQIGTVQMKLVVG